MHKILMLVTLLGGLWLSGAALAVIETYEFSDPELEKRYRELSQELRCPKCQNQNIADSNAPISQDLRRLLHQQLEAGATDQEILEFMVARYGEFVRYRPEFSPATALLWLAPALMLAMAMVVLAILLRRRRTSAPTSLDEDDQARLRELTTNAEREH